MIKQLTIDNFITLQNGELINVFSDESIIVDLSPYKKTHLYKALEKNPANADIYFRKVVSAYINFGKYLLDDKITIDYKYLWDFISQPDDGSGSGLFKNGLNIIILQSPDDDATTKIELICPTNHYSSQVYDIKRKTVNIVF